MVWASNTNFTGLTGAQAVHNGTPTKVPLSDLEQGLTPGTGVPAQALNAAFNSAAGYNLPADAVRFNVQTFTSNGTYVAPAGTVVLQSVLLISSGATGFATRSAFLERHFPGAQIADGATVVVGAAGPSVNPSSITSGAFSLSTYEGATEKSKFEGRGNDFRSSATSGNGDWTPDSLAKLQVREKYGLDFLRGCVGATLAAAGGAGDNRDQISSGHFPGPYASGIEDYPDGPAGYGYGAGGADGGNGAPGLVKILTYYTV